MDEFIIFGTSKAWVTNDGLNSGVIWILVNIKNFKVIFIYFSRWKLVTMLCYL